MTKTGDLVTCPNCKAEFRAKKRQKKYCCESCADEARRIRQRELKRRQRAK